MIYYTKTFTEHQWWRTRQLDDRVEFLFVPHQSPSAVPLDTQIRDWVDSTRAVIVHPGQPGLHKELFENGLLCITIAATVLYREAGSAEAECT